MSRIYFDYNASAPVREAAIETMIECCRNLYGNPSSLHSFGQQAKQMVDRARCQVAQLIQAPPSQIIFTSSGTEANNLAIRGALGNHPDRKQLLTCRSEHSSVLRVFEALESEGYEVGYLPLDSKGLVQPEALAKQLSSDTALVSIMLANNETGVIQPIADLIEMIHSYGALLHVDSVQALGKMVVDVTELGADLMSFSGHKIGAPKGIGALYVRIGCRLTPLLRGGGQEARRRAGTENVPGIAALGRVCAILRHTMDSEIAAMARTRQLFEERITDLFPQAVINGRDTRRIPNTCNISFPGCESDTLLLKLDMAGFAVSAGASCSAGSGEASHVLKAMGLPRQLLYSALRFSWGSNTTAEEVEQLIKALQQLVTID